MIKLDLITGFLGSGKTTFLKKYVSYFLAKGQRIGILENDFGAVNVDVMLLQDIIGENCELETISGGCDCCTHSRRLKTKLIAMGMDGYDRVVMEPSGIFEPEELFDVLYEEPLEKWYEAGNVIAIVDAGLSENLSKSSRYLFTTQLANAGMVVFSKVQDYVSPMSKDRGFSPKGILPAGNLGMSVNFVNHPSNGENQLSRIKKRIASYLREFDCKRHFDENEMLEKNWDLFTGKDFKKLEVCGFQRADYRKFWIKEEDLYSSLYYMNRKYTEQELKELSGRIFRDEKCGNVLRIKGFFRDGGVWHEFNAEGKHMHSRTVKEGQEVLIVIGEKLRKDVIDRYFD